MKTTNALSGSGMANLLIGASDVRTLFSNYVVDMAFYYEHGYHKAFPSFSRLLHDGIADARSLRTPGGRQRREAVAIGASYIRAKIALEAAHKTLLKDRSAQMDRRAAQARKSPAQPQREADFDEVFDTDFRTTGFSRPLDLEYAAAAKKPATTSGASSK
ncbi:hypothetical protein ZWY2020_019577 [Hordeum vulgare]|nr:hypothetical protein ZWY2020_019577 [Hordeum vulgare]